MDLRSRRTDFQTVLRSAGETEDTIIVRWMKENLDFSVRQDEIAAVLKKSKVISVTGRGGL
jgi:ABC-type ATPase with predicted acetyltransferase domain